MVRSIYKFLDDTAGPGVNSRCDGSHSYYNLSSDNGTSLLSFFVDDDWDNFKIYRSNSLCEKLSLFFCIDENESAKHISNWFGERNGIKQVSDLLRYT